MKTETKKQRFLCPYQGRCKKCIHRLTGFCTVLSAPPVDKHDMLLDTCPFHKTLTADELNKVEAIYLKLCEAQQDIPATQDFIDYLQDNFGYLSR